MCLAPDQNSTFLLKSESNFPIILPLDAQPTILEVHEGLKVLVAPLLENHHLPWLIPIPEFSLSEFEALHHIPITQQTCRSIDLCEFNM
jgi:hypothetical protein